MAAGNCRAVQPPDADCWMRAYKACVVGAVGAAGGGCDGPVCDCSARASALCHRDNSVANACYNGVYQKCMSGMFPQYADPDRGRPQKMNRCV